MIDDGIEPPSVSELGLLAAPDVASRLAAACARAGYDLDGTAEALGPVGSALLDRGDLVGAARSLGRTEPVDTLLRLFVLGLPVPEAHARRALEGLDLDVARAAGLVELSAGSVRARLDLRPHGSDQGSWLLVSDLGSDVTHRPVDTEHVLGVGAAALSLVSNTVRYPVGRALDVGVGSGVQSLHLSTHSVTVTGTDLSARALGYAAATAALNRLDWRLVQGDLLEPVGHDDPYDLIVANPPFVVGPSVEPGATAVGKHTYRDGGLGGDQISRRLVGAVPGLLADGGVAQLLANWMVTDGEPWQDTVSAWLPGDGCIAWIWQRELADPAEYVSLWLRDSGDGPARPGYPARYDRWMRWFEDTGVLAVGMGLISIRKATGTSRILAEDVRQAMSPGGGDQIADWFAREKWLHGTSDAQLLATALRAAPDVVLDVHSTPGAAGWQPGLQRLRQATGMRWELDTDQSIAAVVAGCNGQNPLWAVLAVLADGLELTPHGLELAVIPVVRDLVGRGFLLPR